MGARADRGVGMLQGSWGLDETLRRLARLHGDGVLSLDDGSIRRAFAICARQIADPDLRSSASVRSLQTHCDELSCSPTHPGCRPVLSDLNTTQATARLRRSLVCRPTPNPIAVPCVACWRRICVRH